MEITQAYAIAVGGVFLILLSISFLPYLVVLMEKVSLEASRYLTYPQFLRRHRFLGPWAWADVLIQLTYITINIFCVSFQASSVSEAGLRAGNLSLLNMMPLFFGPHLSFLADLLHISLSTYRRIHRSTGLMSFTLLLFHGITIVAVGASFSLSDLGNLHGLIVRIHNSTSGTFHI